jgi:hypothetical protein
MHLLDEILSKPEKMLKFLKTEIIIGFSFNIPFLFILMFFIPTYFGESL